MFTPTQIIFAATDACNLHCEHCFVSRTAHKLSIDDAKAFILSCKNSPDSKIEKVGFSGGEPFLYQDFIEEITKFTVAQDLMFDQLMTNGDWWKTKEDLYAALQKVYDAGYDGKIGLSWDYFHAQSDERIKTFINACMEIFGPDSLIIQCAYNKKKFPAEKKLKQMGIKNNIQVYHLEQSFSSSSPQTWKAHKWFKDDYCQGPGNIFYIHPTGNIAPCCGFANETPELFIGKITDSYATVMKNAASNKMLATCYETGLENLRKQMEKSGTKFPGKCKDICAFCEYVCKL